MALFYLGFSEDLPAQSQRVEIDDVRYLIEVRYNSRTAQWYMDVTNTVTGAQAIGEALTPNSFPCGGRLDLPTFFVVENGPTAEKQRVNTLGAPDVWVFSAED